MAYKTSELLKQSIDAIQKHKLIRIEEVVSYLPCVKKTFYEHKLHESDELKEAIQNIKDTLKAGLRKKWYESDNPTAQIALYKLIASEEESDRINSQRTKHELPEGITINFIDRS